MNDANPIAAVEEEIRAARDARRIYTFCFCLVALIANGVALLFEFGVFGSREILIYVIAYVPTVNGALAIGSIVARSFMQRAYGMHYSSFGHFIISLAVPGGLTVANFAIVSFASGGAC
jgi:hypothetical protein